MYRMSTFGALGCCGGSVPMGADDQPPPPPPQVATAGATPWISGGIILALAVIVFAVDTKGPAALRAAR